MSSPLPLPSPSQSLSRMAAGEGSDKEGSEYSSSEEKGSFEYFGTVFHLGVNSIGHEYCHLRFLLLRGQYVEMYKRDPHENPGIKPIRKGVIGHTLMVEEIGRRRVNQQDVYVLRFYNRLDETKKGEIACATAGEARKWMEAFDQAKQQAEYELLRGGTRRKLSLENELNLEGHRPRVRRYAHGLRKLIRIGKGPETLLRQSSDLGDFRAERYFEGDAGDAIEAHEWKCVRTVNGIRIFEDVSDSKIGKDVLVKAVGVVDANVDAVFEVFVSLDRHRRYEWDMLTSDLELVDSINGHYDVVCGTYDPNHMARLHSKKDFVFSRQWFRGQDGAYTILQFPVVHKKRPPKSGYQRTQINHSTWEMRGLNQSSASNSSRCLVTQILEVPASSGCCIWKKNNWSDFEKTISYALLCQVAGLKEYFEANPAFRFDSSTTVVHSKVSTSSASGEFEDEEVSDEFYDAIAADPSSDDEDSDDDIEDDKMDGKMKLKNVSWAIASLALKRSSVTVTNKELDGHIPPISIDASQYHGSMSQGKDASDTNCWSCPGGQGFMIRGKTYLKDNCKITGGDPLLKLLAVDWFKADSCIDNVALHPKCLVQSEAGKKLPFILVINLEVCVSDIDFLLHIIMNEIHVY
ncbi:protein ENHANCED DISEASE RESISTANCE 2-like [Macadamia integrifolia]|uniref:protein ENHANCED DISEASE RESISTANCE 2-like n=1 Tax=Macadamia integrifolia TaxID=60698 RepID=UPI001C4EEE85|nr:protein ENHANCED DISEASE RESISTANCE 2-like [Macadamia integrifolia]